MTSQAMKDNLERITKLPPPQLIFAREIDDLVKQVENEWVEQNISVSSHHDGYLAALKKVQELVDVYGFKRA